MKITEKIKNIWTRHKGKIIIGGMVIGSVVIYMLTRQSGDGQQPGLAKYLIQHLYGGHGPSFLFFIFAQFTYHIMNHK